MGLHKAGLVTNKSYDKQIESIIIRSKFFFVFIGRDPTTWPANNCQQIMVCSCAMPSNCVWLQIIFCTCVTVNYFEGHDHLCNPNTNLMYLTVEWSLNTNLFVFITFLYRCLFYVLSFHEFNKIMGERSDWTLQWLAFDSSS